MKSMKSMDYNRKEITRRRVYFGSISMLTGIVLLLWCYSLLYCALLMVGNPAFRLGSFGEIIWTAGQRVLFPLPDTNPYGPAVVIYEYSWPKYILLRLVQSDLVLLIPVAIGGVLYFLMRHIKTIIIKM